MTTKLVTSSTAQYIAIRDDAASISNAERDFIRSTAVRAQSSSIEGSDSKPTATTTTRLDGRSLHERRPVRVSLTRSDNLAVATVLLGGGETRVTCRVTGQLMPPANLDRPTEGSVAFSVDVSPSASTRYRFASPASTGGRESSNGNNFQLPLADRHQTLTTNHILRCLERCLLQSGSNSSNGALDTEALCVVPGVWAWRLSVDVCITDADGGNLLDAAVLSCMAAVRHYRKPIVETEQDMVQIIAAHQREPTPLPLHHTPLSITFALFQDDSTDGASSSTSRSGACAAEDQSVRLLIDPTHREELCQSGSLTIAMNAHAEMCLLDFGGGCELSVAKLRDCHAHAVAHIAAASGDLEDSLAQADEQALAERLRELQQRNFSNQNWKPPPLLSTEVLPPPEALHFSSVTTAAVQSDTLSDQAAAELAVQEAYRTQALDYNIGHVPSKLQEDDSVGAASRRGPVVSTGTGNLLTAMLRSVGGAVAEETTSVEVPSTATAVMLYETLASTIEGTTSKKETRNVATKTAKMNTSDDEEESPVVLHSEFAQIQTSQPMKGVVSSPAEAENIDDEHVDDLAAAITKKKKKKSKKK